jgi:hypothetical protein
MRILNAVVEVQQQARNARVHVDVVPVPLLQDLVASAEGKRTERFSEKSLTENDPDFLENSLKNLDQTRQCRHMGQAQVASAGEN